MVRPLPNCCQEARDSSLWRLRCEGPDLIKSGASASARWQGGRLRAMDATKTRAPHAPALLFDLDGTLIDSVYQHVLAWQEALLGAGIELSVWKLHRRIGM